MRGRVPPAEACGPESCRSSVKPWNLATCDQTLKVWQYKLGDRLDKIRLPGNPRLVITRKGEAGDELKLEKNNLTETELCLVCIKFNRPQFLNSLDSSLINPTAATLR